MNCATVQSMMVYHHFPNTYSLNKNISFLKAIPNMVVSKNIGNLILQDDLISHNSF